MKTCGRCNKEKDLSCFSSRGPGKLQSWCKQCFTEYDRVRYHEGDKVRKNENRQKRSVRQKAMLNDIKLQSGCVDCGYNEHAVALDFDHVRGVKKFNLGEMRQRGLGDAALLEEVAKCEVRCANCHRVRTHII